MMSGAPAGERDIEGVGVDVVHIPRIAAALDRFGARFASRILAPEELGESGEGAHACARVAKRFAAKEAFFKAIGTGLARGASWHDLIVEHEPRGRPWLRVRTRSAELMRRFGPVVPFLSLSDEGDYAVAVVILGRRTGRAQERDSSSAAGGG